ncbi:hypothetical protein FCF16_07800 [Lentilactobacillus buchneri]|nr:hypothetical protein [Lentilactobacillus buchneri]MCT3541662.1 hypothetical protein [Lentilactobacillus buchneri]MCT3543947.1 hypothetical protein [Lentilactobacillus buchneri]MCT3553004.1 hypothetical protein [Lentilactobacillus buchneri]TJY00814.1 hypothetical protein FCF17_07685 [Lentilactobacillus buchneri]
MLILNEANCSCHL